MDNCEERDCINVLALVKGRERYIFLYDDKHKEETLGYLGRFASNPGLESFTWSDAAVLSQKIRREYEDKSKPISREKGIEILFGDLFNS